MFRTRTPARALVSALSAAVLAAGCRDITSPAQDPTAVSYAPGLNIRLADFTRDTSGVYYQDVAVGSGTAVVPNSTVSYYYTGYLADGRQFGTNTTQSSPTTFLLGTSPVRGFNLGLLGVRAGGRRRLIIPPALAYGDRAQGTVIPAGSVLIFVVDVPAVTAPTTTTTTTSRAPR